MLVWKTLSQVGCVLGFSTNFCVWAVMPVMLAKPLIGPVTYSNTYKIQNTGGLFICYLVLKLLISVSHAVLSKHYWISCITSIFNSFSSHESEIIHTFEQRKKEWITEWSSQFKCTNSHMYLYLITSTAILQIHKITSSQLAW